MWAVLASVFLSTVVVVAIVIARSYAVLYSTTGPAKGFTLRKFRNANVLSSKPTLSVVIPCYNEEERLPSMLKDCVEYIRTLHRQPPQERAFRDIELIIVDDCSKDRTAAVAEAYLSGENKSHPKDEDKILYHVVPVRPNHGKGYAVRTGFFASSGDLVLMADGDNATKFSDVEKLASRMQGVDIIAGSRAHLEEASIASRTLSRTILMKVFHIVVNVTFFVGTLGKVCSIRDTQCGFKLFRREPSMLVFLNNRLERWAFDVELLILASRFGLTMAEVPVTWQEIPGSKVNFRGMAQMGFECVLMCFAYPLRFWPITAAA